MYYYSIAEDPSLVLYRQCENTTVVPSELTKRVPSSDRTNDLQHTYSRSIAETTMNPFGQNIPVIYLHLEDTMNNPASF